jgi:hypothetical protein
MRNFIDYKKLPRDVQSLATQHFLMEWLFALNVKEERQLSLAQRLRVVRDELSKKIRHSYQVLYQLPPERLLARLESEIDSRYWRVKLKGKPIVSKYKFSRLMQLTKHQPIYTEKAFFVLLSLPCATNHNLKPVIEAFSLQIQNILLSKNARIHQNRSLMSFDELSTIINRKYASRINELCNIRSLDSLTALLIIAIYQQCELNEPRPTYAEKCAFELFVKLFAIKYCPINTSAIAFRIAQLLMNFSPHSHKQGIHFVKPTTEYFDHVFTFLKADNITLKRGFTFDQKVLNECLHNFDDSKYLNQKELGFLTK